MPQAVLVWRLNMASSALHWLLALPIVYCLASVLWTVPCVSHFHPQTSFGTCGLFLWLFCQPCIVHLCVNANCLLTQPLF